MLPGCPPKAMHNVWLLRGNKQPHSEPLQGEQKLHPKGCHDGVIGIIFKDVCEANWNAEILSM